MPQKQNIVWWITGFKQRVALCSIVWKYVFLLHILHKNKNIINAQSGTFWKSQKLIPGKRKRKSVLFVTKISPHKTKQKSPICKNKLRQKNWCHTIVCINLIRFKYHWNLCLDQWYWGTESVKARSNCHPLCLWGNSRRLWSGSCYWLVTEIRSHATTFRQAFLHDFISACRPLSFA